MGGEISPSSSGEKQRAHQRRYVRLTYASYSNRRSCARQESGHHSGATDSATPAKEPGSGGRRKGPRPDFLQTYGTTEDRRPPPSAPHPVAPPALRAHRSHSRGECPPAL